MASKYDEIAKKRKIVASWKKRKAKIKPKISWKKFCAEEGLDAAGISRVINEKVIPTWETIEAVNVALDSRGV